MVRNKANQREIEIREKPRPRNTFKEKRQEWSVGSKTNTNFSVLSVDGSWKLLMKEQRLVAAIAWINEMDTRSYSSKKIYAVSPIQAEAYVVL